MKRFFLILVMALGAVNSYGQKIGVKTNVIYDATATFNLGFEVGLGDRLTLDVSGNYNPWQFDNKEWKHWLVQPEVRLWTCEKFQGHFFGLHAHCAQFSVGGIGFLPIPGFMNDKGFVGGDAYGTALKNRRFEGNLYGAGLSWGYQWIISDRCNVEATVGLGFAMMEFRSWPMADCGTAAPWQKHTYWGVTKVGLSLIYFIH